MRTTINIDEDVLLAVQERAHREHRSAGQVLSELAREALLGQVSSRPAPALVRNGFTPLASRGKPVSNALIDRLREHEPE
jgi:hypothetical protein